MSRARPRTTLFDLPLDLLTCAEAVDLIMESVESGDHITHMSLNAPKVVAASNDVELQAALQTSDLVTADGSWVAFAARLCGVLVPERFGGIDLFYQLLSASADGGKSVFFFGATDSVVERVAAVSVERFPGLKVAGTRNGFFDDTAAPKIATAIREADTDLLFLGFPSPRKEKWLRDNFQISGAGFGMGVGGSFDVLVGDVPRAPKAVRAIGAEWAWRVMREPRRLWNRYSRVATPFLLATVREAWRHHFGGSPNRGLSSRT